VSEPIAASWARRVLVAGGVVLALGLLGLMCARVAERGRFASAYSTWSAGPAGARGAFVLVERLGARPMRWAEDFGRLPPGGMLVALGGCELLAPRDVSRQERRQLAQWVAAGGTLVVAGAHDYLPAGGSAPPSHAEPQPDGGAGREGDTGREGDAGRGSGAARDGGHGRGDRPAARGAGGPQRRGEPAPSLGVHLARDAETCVPRTGLLGAMVRAARRADRDREAAGDRDAGAERAADGVRSDAPVDADDLLRPDQLRESLDEQPIAPALTALVVGGPLLGLGATQLRDPATVVIDAPLAAEVVLRLPDDRVAGVVVRHGRGRVVALASASPFQNRDLAAADGGALLARLVRAYAPEGPVLFDEYHLGAGEARSTVRYMSDLGAGPLLLQVLAVVAFALWRAGARFGSPRPEPPPAPAGTASYVGGVASLYGKARDARALLAVLARRALGRVAAHHRVPPVDPALLAAALEDRGRARAAAEVRRIEEIAASADPAARLVERVRAIDAALARATSADAAAEAALDGRGER
jgi:hypothetical protein